MNATDVIEQFHPSGCLSVTLRNFETVKDSYNSGSSENRTSGGHFHQSCHVTVSSLLSRRVRTSKDR